MGGRLPAIEKLLKAQKFECDEESRTMQIVGTAKLAAGLEVALMDYCGMGAYTDSIVVLQLENGKPVLSKFEDGGNLEFTQGASVMHELGVQLVPEQNAIFSLGSDNDGCHLLDCSAEAYVWNPATHRFRADPMLSQLGWRSYCHHIQQELAKEVGRDRRAKSTSTK